MNMRHDVHLRKIQSNLQQLSNIVKGLRILEDVSVIETLVNSYPTASNATDEIDRVLSKLHSLIFATTTSVRLLASDDFDTIERTIKDTDRLLLKCLAPEDAFEPEIESKVFDDFDSNMSDAEMPHARVKEEPEEPMLEDDPLDDDDEDYVVVPAAKKARKKPKPPENVEPPPKDSRKNLKELIIWLCQVANSNDPLPDSFDPLKGQCSTFYGLSPKKCKYSQTRSKWSPFWWKITLYVRYL